MEFMLPMFRPVRIGARSRWPLAVAVSIASAIGCGRDQDIPLAGAASATPAAGTAVDDQGGGIDLAPESDGASRQPERPSRPGDGQSVDKLWQRAAEGAAEAPIPENPPSRADFLSPERLAAAGLRRLKGKHLVLVTDLPEDSAIEGLPAVFDLAVPLWAAYFGVPPDRWNGWRATGYLMADQEAFRALGLLPPELPTFKNGYTLGPEFWFNQQKTDYYRRHLMLHEGVHSFMFTFFGSCGPPWYMEGMAELLGTHRLGDGQIELPYYPKHKEEVPLLGRIRIVQDELAARRVLPLEQIMRYGPGAHLLRNQPYGWCWAAMQFLDNHPRYRDRFRELARQSDKEGDAVNRTVQAAYAADWRELGDEWLVYVLGIEHKYDFDRMAVEFDDGGPLTGTEHRVTIAADHGWQSTGVRLTAGTTYRIEARGRYVIAKPSAGETWFSEPGGVTIRYYQGRPLGMLLGAVRRQAAEPNSVGALAMPQGIGLQANWKPQQDGTLYVRVNDSAAELADNAGTLEVQITQIPK